MADPKKRRPENTEGNFFVDESCIDCDTCRWMAPDFFHRMEGQSAVFQQPNSRSEEALVLNALLSCPTGSIGVNTKTPIFKTAPGAFPALIEKDVFHSGYHSEKSFGAASYFLRRPEGNVLIDSPRFVGPLVKKLEELGGLRYMFLSHKDDIADHKKFAALFNCERILHKDDQNHDTADVERLLSGQDDLELEKDLKIITVPGHTRGHLVLLFRENYLFTGDHLAWSSRLNQLIAFRNACWYSWPEQLKSMKKLLQHKFEFVLPGHGRRFQAPNDRMQTELKKCIAWMEIR